jgi:hypothetical protein
VGDLHEVLVVALPNPDLVFPAVILANDERSDAFRNQQIDNPPAMRVQVVVNLARPSRGQPFHPLRASRLSEFGLQFGATLVVALVDVLEWTTIYENGYKTRLR